MGKTFGIAPVHVLGGAMPDGSSVTVRAGDNYGLQAENFGASRLLEGLNNIGGGL